MFDEDASVTRLYLELREGREEAATDLWQLCCQALVREARKQLSPNERRASDEEDIALAVFHELCQGVSDGRLSEDLRREDLTKLLRHFTRQETLDQRRHAQRAKRGGGFVRGESVFAFRTNGDPHHGDFHSVPSREASPDLIVQLDDQLQRLLGSLDDDRLRQVALSVLAGDSRAETAEKLGLSLRSVERKVALIREAWQMELEESRGERQSS
jgi:DNA-directed RNA polymerase specialized sigma24 family protein